VTVDAQSVSRRRYSLLQVALLFVGLSVLGFIYTSHVQRQSDARQDRARQVQDQRWCDLFETLDRPVPPTIKDPVQRQRSEQTQILLHRLRVDLGCVKE